MSSYLARCITPSHWEVTKWGDAPRPMETYTLLRKGTGWRCDSPGCGRTDNCKHVRVLEMRMLQPQDEMPERMYEL